MARFTVFLLVVILLLIAVLAGGCAAANPWQSQRGNEQWADVPINVTIHDTGEGPITVNLDVRTHGGQAEPTGGSIGDTSQVPTADVQTDLDLQIPLVP